MKVFVTVVLAVCFSASLAMAGFKEMSSKEAQKLLAKDRQVFLLDVRTPDEYRRARLKGAVLIPVGELQGRLKEVPANRPILVYCAVGARSRAAADLLAGRGYATVYNMSDGIMGWYRNGLPVEKP